MTFQGNSMNKTYIIGVDIGGTKISTGILTLNGNLQEVVTVPTFADKPKETIIIEAKIRFIPAVSLPC